MLSILVLLMALLTWSLRRQHKLQVRLAALKASPTVQLDDVQDQRITQRAVALLHQALVADTHLIYSATTETWADYGGKVMHSRARITRAPQKLAISYLTGDKRGLQTGFSDRWFWRQENLGAPMRPFAAMVRDTTEVVMRRFATLLENYSAEWKGEDKVDGRTAEIVELWPFQTVDGASGPGKRLFIDHETGLVLRVETFNHQRQQVMTTQLTDLDFSPHISKDTFKTPQTLQASARKQPWVAQDMGHDTKAVAKQTGLMPPQLAAADLPPGFELESVGMHRCIKPGQEDVYAALSRYTDGLNTLTVFSFKEKVKPEKSSEQACEFGPGAVVVRDTDQGRVIAVGDLCPSTLRRVAEKTKVEPVTVNPAPENNSSAPATGESPPGDAASNAPYIAENSPHENAHENAPVKTGANQGAPPGNANHEAALSP